MRAKARPSVQALRPRVAPPHFQMQRGDPFLAADFGGKFDARLTDPSSAKTLAQVKFVNEGVAPAKLKAEAERQDEIARRLRAQADQVYHPEPAFAQNLLQRNARRRFVERYVVERIKLSHQLDEFVGVRRTGKSKDRFHGIRFSMAG